jgi:sec-independent protein translocase protein TatA
MPSLGAPELLILLVIVLVLFGGSLLPKLVRTVGETRRELEKARGDNPS